MRDLVEARHSSFIGNSKYYYKEAIKKKNNPNDYINFVKNYITNQRFNILTKEPWTYINLSNEVSRTCGWKIHVSATFKNHLHVLNLVAEYAINKQINFKFSSNLNQFIYINSKTVGRESSGKFIVLYPLEKEFVKTLEELYIILKDFDGPYILSDRPFKDSKNIYYRFGEIVPIRTLDGYGTITTKMLDNKNNLFSDKRVPYFHLPDFVKDELYKLSYNTKSKLTDKYDIKKSLHFSAQGGVYLATYNNQNYVIKEARKYAGLDDNFQYGAERLKKEYFILKSLEKLNCAPIPVELIEEHGNVYLVEEYLKGQTILRFSLSKSPLIKVNKKDDKIKEEFVKHLNTIIHSSLTAISKIHKSGMIINDISSNNIIYDFEDGRISFIDYEAAYNILDECNKINMYTPGFTSEGGNTAVQDDLHKLGLVFISCIMPVNSIFSLSSKKKIESVQLFDKLNIIPKIIIDIILGLIDSKFNNADEALKYFNSSKSIEKKNQISAILETDVESNIETIKKAIISNIDCSSVNEMVAIDPMGFITSKYSFAYGIFGVLYSLHKIHLGENMCQEKIRLIVKRFMSDFYRLPNSISSGLYVGLSGIVVSLLELGFIDESKIVMENLVRNKIEMKDLAYGEAGRLVALLKLYKTTKITNYLKEAEKNADEIINTALIREGLNTWCDESGHTYTGLTRGSSGVALVLLYLFLETKKERYLNMGIKSLEADLSNLEKNELENICFNSLPEGSDTKIYSPYIHNGIAGLGCVLLRYFLVTRKEKYRVILNEIIEACDLDITLFPGYLRGMAGVMTFLQDCVVYLNSDHAKKILVKLSDNISFFQVSVDGIQGYAGDELFRISHDLFTGSSGILLALNRNVCLSDKPSNPFLVLDEYYDHF